MVLHLLGKKSWNVYNSENVERVRRDEAEAQAREDAEELRMQEADAARRIALLRGEELPEPRQQADAEGLEAEQAKRSHERGLPRKRRRLRGEDDTDRDIRYAREDAAAGDKAKGALSKRDEIKDAPLTDHAGHLQLIPAPDEKAVRKAEKNAEAEAEKAKRRKREEDQYTMRFSNAAGFNNDMAKPWYASNGSAKISEVANDAVLLPHVQDKDVWGNEDLRRKDRERNCISRNDPFAAMQQAQRQLKQSDRDKEKWRQERSGEIAELERAEQRRRRDKKRRRRDDAEDGLDDFSLDAASSEKERRRDRHRHHHRHHRHRSRSRSPSRDRHRRSSHHSRRG